MREDSREITAEPAAGSAPALSLPAAAPAASTEPLSSPGSLSAPAASVLSAWLALAATLLLWASAFPATKVAMTAISPGPLAFFRFLIASVALLVLVSKLGARVPALTDMPRLALAGVLCVTVYQLGHNYGLVTVASGPAAVLIDTIPLWAALIGAFLLREKLSALGWLGSVIAFGGAAMIGLSETPGSITLDRGALWLIIAAIAFAAAGVIAKPMVQRYGPLTTTAWSFFFGTLALVPFAAGLMREIEAAPRSALLWCVYLGLFPGALGYVWWNRALGALPVAIVASTLYLIPPLTFALAWLWLGELPGVMAWVGGAITLIGVALTQLKGRA